MRHVPVFCDDLQALDGLNITHNIVQDQGTVLFNPGFC